jgi:hypothetical protein
MIPPRRKSVLVFGLSSGGGGDDDDATKVQSHTKSNTVDDGVGSPRLSKAKRRGSPANGVNGVNVSHFTSSPRFIT